MLLAAPHGNGPLPDEISGKTHFRRTLRNLFFCLQIFVLISVIETLASDSGKNPTHTSQNKNLQAKS